MNRRLSISVALICVAFLFAIPIAAAPPAGHAPAPAVTPVSIVEEFDSSAGFTQTDPDVYISGGQVYWTIRRYEGQQYVYRSIPAFDADAQPHGHGNAGAPAR